MVCEKQSLDPTLQNLSEMFRMRNHIYWPKEVPKATAATPLPMFAIPNEESYSFWNDSLKTKGRLVGMPPAKTPLKVYIRHVRIV